MSAVLLLLAKDARKLARSPALAAGLLAYPLLIALLVGVVARYAGERPRVALVGGEALPEVFVIGDDRFEVAALFADAGEVELVPMSAGEARRQLQTGEILAMVSVPSGFAETLRGLRASPTIVLETAGGGISTRVVEKVRAMLQRINRDLQQSYVEANLAVVDLVLRGGSATIGESTFTLLGLERATTELEMLEGAAGSAGIGSARRIEEFHGQLAGAIGQVASFLAATAHPIELITRVGEARSWLLSAQVQTYALALAVALLAILLGAGFTTLERAENVIGRLVQGEVRIGALLAEKVLFAAAVGALLGLVLACAFGVVIEAGEVSGGQPWARLPPLLAALFLVGATFGTIGVLLGTLARDAGTATMVAFLIALPLLLVGVVPRGAPFGLGWLAASSPLPHVLELLRAALYEPDPAASIGWQASWLGAFAVVFLGLSRLGARRLLA